MFLSHFPKATSFCETAAKAEEYLLWFAEGHMICGQVEYSQSAAHFCASEPGTCLPFLP